MNRTMQIFVRGPGNYTSVVDIGGGETVLTLKRLLWVRLGIPVENVWMESGGRMLHDQQTMGECRIMPESTIWCHVRVGGGPCLICERGENR